MSLREAPILLPRPRRMTVKEGFGELPPGAVTLGGDVPTDWRRFVPDGRVVNPVEARVRCRIDDTSAHPQSYRLLVERTGSDARVEIRAPNLIGISYGLRTFAQLRYTCGPALPALEIVDQPQFTVRGVLWDVSRDRVPTMELLRRLVQLFAFWKINHLQLYTEHTFAYQGHEVVWKDASPITAEEVVELDALCRELGITLAANQACFGHMTRWLQHPPYADLAETHGRWRFGSEWRTGPFSLCPMDPRALRLVEDLLSQLLPNFSSRLVNINCDETYDVGQGRSQAAAAEGRLNSVWWEFVNGIVRAVRKHGFRAMMWADIPLQHPEALSMMPKDVIALVWGYEPDSALLEHCNRLADWGFRVWVCPGTSSWRSITGRTAERRGNYQTAVMAARESGADGFIVTDWGDLGHRQQLPVSLHGLAEGADAAWSGSTRSDWDPRASGIYAFGDPDGYIGVWLDRLGDVDRALRAAHHFKNKSALFNDLHRAWNALSPSEGRKKWLEVVESLDELDRQFPAQGDILVRAELRHTWEAAKFAADRAVLRRSKVKPQSKVESLRHRREQIITEHRRLWLLRSRPGGLDDSCRYYREVDLG